MSLKRRSACTAQFNLEIAGDEGYIGLLGSKKYESSQMLTEFENRIYVRKNLIFEMSFWSMQFVICIRHFAMLPQFKLFFSPSLLDKWLNIHDLA